MANIFLQDLKYLTIDELKFSTLNDLRNQTDEIIQEFIGKGENKINSMIKTDNIVVNNKLKQATLLITICLYKKSLEPDKEILQENNTEKYRGHSVTKNITYIEKNNSCVNEEITELLKDFPKIFIPRGNFYRT